MDGLLSFESSDFFWVCFLPDDARLLFILSYALEYKLQFGIECFWNNRKGKFQMNCGTDNVVFMETIA